MRLRPAAQCRWDLVSLGEVMLRLDPGEGRIHTARSFNVWEGGGEYNVARGMRRCFRRRSAVVTAFADNAVGRLLEDLILQGGVDPALLRFVPFDGIGAKVRNGLNFTERGFGPRAALGCSDRAQSAASQMRPGEVDWNDVFGKQGSVWFHTGGIYCGLSETTRAVAKEAMEAAHRHDVRVSYDLNYRPSLWKASGGQPEAHRVNRELVSLVDVLFGNEEDFSAALGYEIPNTDKSYSSLSTDNFRRMIDRVVKDYPNIKSIATSLRTAKTASINGWGGLMYHEGEYYEVPQKDIAILDRVGGGDSFASGIIYGLITDHGPKWALACGVAHGALAMSTPGDTSTVSLAEIEKALAGSARIDR